jgi:hypothetical protein
MNRRPGKLPLGLAVAAYFAASLATVVLLVSVWYSTGGEYAVARQHEKPRDLPCLSWAARTHLPLVDQKEQPQSLPPTPCNYPLSTKYHVVPSEPPLSTPTIFFFAGLSNKAPPTV